MHVAQAFSSLALVGLLTQPTVLFVQVLPRVMQAKGCFDRIQEYCNYNSNTSGIDPPAEPLDNIPTGSGDRSLFHQDQELFMMRGEPGFASNAIYIKDGTFRRKTDGPHILKDITVAIPQGTMTVLIGPVGSGKTTLLESILGETLAETNKVTKSKTSVSYCAQQPWLENRSIRDNIVCDGTFDDKWYQTVITACGLDSDIEQLPAGDATNVGSNGVSLSGGQKQRVALARAVYARSRVVLLDDVFSGLDASTINIVSRRLLRSEGLLRRNRSTIVLATTNSGFVYRF